MGTPAYALFSHSGDAREVAAVCRRLVAERGFAPADDDLSGGPLARAWSQGRPLTLDWTHGLLRIYPKTGGLYHGTGRDGLRERSRAVARLFGGDRILYVADDVGCTAALDGGDLAAEEAFLRGHLGPPQAWGAPAGRDVRARWTVEAL